MDDVAVDDEWFLEPCDDLLGGMCGGLHCDRVGATRHAVDVGNALSTGSADLAGHVAEQYGKFIATETTHEVRLADAGQQPPGGCLQQGIPRGMTERIVHVLEPIEVEIEDGEACAVMAHP